MNVLMLDEKRVMVEKNETNIHKMFEKLGNVIHNSFLPWLKQESFAHVLIGKFQHWDPY